MRTYTFKRDCGHIVRGTSRARAFAKQCLDCELKKLETEHEPGQKRGGKMNWVLIDVETDTVVDNYMTEHDALMALEAAERKYRAQGYHRFVVRDPGGATYHRAECVCGQEHGAA